ncbi:hypothetical protein KUV80_08415 [Fictibacillus nanhaiensis]|uniref:hypothetical protein n=1 Tax=Fictibacillus nanhaiensis TaxID=742169 RepID=UPI001C971F8F|nr:hypothetical protein [Fictibacillus nanhaiensis]MBY6036673.1 hypothetical protein [Fictibacillus nanhaiensis]
MLKRLTNEDLISEMRTFQKYEMDTNKRDDILRELRLLKTEKKKIGAPQFVKPILSFLVLAFFLAGSGLFAITQINNSPTEFKSGIHGNETYSIQKEDHFIIKQNKDGSSTFMADGKKVGGIEPLNEEEMMKSIQKQNVFKNQEVEGYRYRATYTLDHQKTMEVVQILHYYFVSPESNLRYHVYFYTPFFDEESADELARSFTIIADGKELKTKDEWALSTTFTSDNAKTLIGDRERLGILGPEFITGKIDKYVWHFFGGHNEIEIISNGDFKVIGIHEETGMEEQVLVENVGTVNEKQVWQYEIPEQSPLSGDTEVGSIHAITSHMKFSKPGVWRLDVSFGGKRAGSIIVEVK